jgi:hypothetical protein
MQLHQNYTVTKYNRFVFDAVASKEQFQDVHTITLKGEFMKDVEMAAVDVIMKQRLQLTQSNVRKEMVKLVISGKFKVQEAVYNTSEGMFVIVNADSIDDAAVSKVVEMVSVAMDELDSAYGTFKFNQPVTFTLADIPWINYH